MNSAMPIVYSSGPSQPGGVMSGQLAVPSFLSNSTWMPSCPLYWNSTSVIVVVTGQSATFSGLSKIVASWRSSDVGGEPPLPPVPAPVVLLVCPPDVAAALVLAAFDVVDELAVTPEPLPPAPWLSTSSTEPPSLLPQPVRGNSPTAQRTSAPRFMSSTSHCPRSTASKSRGTAG